MTKIRKQLYREPVHGKIAGVCAGIARYFGWEVWVVRIAAVTCLLLMTSVTLTAYIVAWLILDKAPSGAEPDTTKSQLKKEESRTELTPDGRTIEVKTKVWEAGKPPATALIDIETRFSRLEDSLRRMEGYVTSSEFRVRQEINRL